MLFSGQPETEDILLLRWEGGITHALFLRTSRHKAGSLKMNTALEYSIVQEWSRRGTVDVKKSTLNNLVHLSPLMAGSLKVFLDRSGVLNR
jgi:hypothetical protein